MAALEHVPLVGEANLARRPPILRARHLNSRQQEVELLADRNDLRSRAGAWRREVSKGTGLPVGDDVR